ncbi:hypothetical protein NHX12_013925, partial [Muraenolepis orangiensis]
GLPGLPTLAALHSNQILTVKVCQCKRSLESPGLIRASPGSDPGLIRASPGSDPGLIRASPGSDPGLIRASPRETKAKPDLRDPRGHRAPPAQGAPRGTRAKTGPEAATQEPPEKSDQ